MLIILSSALAAPPALLPTRLQQRHSGAWVLGGGTVTADGHMLASREVTGLGDVRPQVTADAAIAAAIAASGSPMVPPDAALWILPDGRGGRLVWRVSLWVSALGGEQRVTVDALTGAVLMRTPLRLHAQGRVYSHSVIEADLTEVTLEGLDGATELSGLWADVYSVVIADDAVTLARHAAADESGDFLYEPDHGSFDDPFAEVSMYHHVTSAASHFAEVLGHPVPGVTEVYANYHTAEGSPFDNAYFTYTAFGGYQLVFGQGSERDFGYMPDVAFHELGHGVVEDATGIMENLYYPINFDTLGFHVGPGALTEGLPDYFAASYHNNPLIGAYEGFSPIRDLSEPLRCPEDIWGEAHIDGNVLGAALWSVRAVVGVEDSDALVYATMAALPPSPSFADFSTTLLATAAGQGLDEDGITAALEAHGLIGCDRAISLAPGEQTVGVFIGADILSESLCELMRNGNINLTPAFQLALTVPDDARPGAAIGLSFDLASLSGADFGPSDLQYTALARQGEPVTFALDFFDLIGELAYVSEGAEFELTFPDEPETLWIEDVSPGEVWYVAMMGNNCLSAQYTAEALWEDGPEPEVAGCGCSAARPVGSVGLLGLLLVVCWRRE